MTQLLDIRKLFYFYDIFAYSYTNKTLKLLGIFGMTDVPPKKKKNHRKI